MLEIKKSSPLIKDMIKYLGFDFTIPEYSRMNLDKEYVTIHKFATDFAIRNHLLGRYAICLNRYHHSKVYCVDVDFHDNNIPRATRTIKKLVDLIGDPFFIEISDNPDGGFHLYYKFDRYLYPKSWSNLQTYLKNELNLIIETITGNKKFKLPFSVNYKKYGKFSLNKRDLVDPLPLEESILLFKESKPISPNNFLNSLPFYNTPVEAICSKKDSNKQHFQWSSFTYGEGQRTSTQFKLAIRSVYWGESFNDYINQCYNNNAGSKDMSNWSSLKIRKDLEAKWKKANKFVTPQESVTKNVSNKSLYIISDYDKYIDSNEKQYLYDYISKLYNGKYKKASNRFIEDCIKLYLYCLSSLKYRQKKNFTYEGEFEFLNGSLPLSRDIREKLAKELYISNHHRVYKFLVEIGLLNLVKNSRGYSYSYKIKKWVQHFILTPISEIIKFLKESVVSNLNSNFLKKIELIIDNCLNFYYNNISTLLRVTNSS